MQTSKVINAVEKLNKSLQNIVNDKTKRILFDILKQIMVDNPEITINSEKYNGMIDTLIKMYFPLDINSTEINTLFTNNFH